MEKELNNCYHLPWTESDNPNGWIEPTTYCNIKCPGCYRGADKSDHKPSHLLLEEVIKQIDWYVKNRNIHTLSVSGGDPLLYPQLVEVIEYAAKRRLRVMVYTNGILLTREMIIKLRNAGVTQFLVHIDKFQSRPDMKNGMSVSDLQQRFCNLFREIGGILLGFIQPLTAGYREDIKAITAIAQNNIDIVSLLVFTLYREICWESKTNHNISTDLTIKEVVEAYSEVDGFVPASYLGSENNQCDATWVFGTKVGYLGNNLGYFSPSFYKYSHERYRKKKGRYLFISQKNTINVLGLFRFLRFGGIRKIIMKFLKSLLKGKLKKVTRVYFQTILLLRGPEKKHSKWDLCEGCPDRIIHNGRLVPSCILEDLKTKENVTFKKVEFKN